MRPVILILLLSACFAASPVFAQSEFDRVPLDHWAYDSLAYVSAEGFLPAVYDGWFNRSRELTHGQMLGFATLLSQVVLLDRPDSVNESQWEEVRILVHSLNKEFGHQLNVSSVYEDVPLDHWSYAALDYLCREGVLEGYPEGFFNGERSLTRYEFAQAVAHLLDSVGMHPDESAKILAGALRAGYSDQLAEIQRGIEEWSPERNGI